MVDIFPGDPGSERVKINFYVMLAYGEIREVLDVVRSNYDTLTLKLYDNLDQYEKYTEKPIESAFFTPLVRSIITEYRTSLNFKSLEMQRIMKEFSTIS
ncbi:UPF0668 protein C10orf76 [Araneus ventricosus]|uniref:UPF0668 protein C10orf76 n=1 Tax=Araneus ventricosus TaxID=182803 RepID=A0A4Y2TLI9_ARAVE|nr:UPF0668 protein C10orf76 [Araneus ventricosus]